MSDGCLVLLSTNAKAILIVGHQYEANHTLVDSATPITRNARTNMHTPRRATLESPASVQHFHHETSLFAESVHGQLLTTDTFPRCFQSCQYSTTQG